MTHYKRTARCPVYGVCRITEHAQNLYVEALTLMNMFSNVTYTLRLAIQYNSTLLIFPVVSD